MIIYDLDLVSVIAFPSKYNPPLGINTDTPEALKLSVQFFESVSWGNPEKVDGWGCIDLVESPPGFFM